MGSENLCWVILSTPNKEDASTPCENVVLERQKSFLSRSLHSNGGGRGTKKEKVKHEVISAIKNNNRIMWQEVTEVLLWVGDADLFMHSANPFLALCTSTKCIMLAPLWLPSCFSLSFWPLCVVCGTFLTGIKPGSLQWEHKSLNYWTTREVLEPAFWLNSTSRRLGEWEERESLACFGMYFLALAHSLVLVLIRLPRFHFFPLSLQGP